MSNDFLFTSESVSEGHPDKVADQISDAILDAIFAQDPRSPRRRRDAVQHRPGRARRRDHDQRARRLHPGRARHDQAHRLRQHRVRHRLQGLRGAWSATTSSRNDIAQGVDHASDDHLNTGAGDQGLMFGYACDETPELMPAPIYYAHRLVERQAQLRKDGRLPFLRPDAKSQVTMRYVDGKPHSIDTVVLSTQHAPEQSETATKMKASFIEAVIEEIIKPVLPKEWLQGHAVPDQPDRPLRHRRPAGRLRPDRPQDHRRHLRRRLPARRRRVLGQGPVEGRPLGRLRGALRGEEHRRRRPRAPVPDPGRLRDRRRQADERHGLHRRHRQGQRRQDRRSS